MEFVIAITGAYERGHGLEMSSLPERIGSGGTGVVRLFESTPLRANRSMSKLSPFFSQKPIGTLCGSLKSLRPITLELVSGSELEPVWDYLVKQFHYLGYQKLFGHRLKYLALRGEHPVAALSWSAAALKVGVRDCFIGWSEEQKKTYLDRIANNSRFVIFPWVLVPHLASHVLSLNIRRLARDWEQQFHQPLWLLETFVDPSRFKGTSYKAANWKCLGQTRGFGKEGVGYVYHGSLKEVYVYVLEPRFRKILGCEPRPLFRRPPPSLEKVEELKMILNRAHWNPQLVPGVALTEKDVKDMAEELVQFHQQFDDCFRRIEQERLGLAYLSGLMSNLKAKSAEPMALEFLGEEDVRSLQRFMKTYLWDHEMMELKHQLLLSPLIAHPQGMINVDSSEFVKKGKESVGVSRQYCGAIGKVENCQSGVFAGYSSEKGYGLLTSRLYLPEIWFSPAYAQRRKDNLVPQDLTFQTKIEIALALIHRVARTKLFPARWIGCDASFGSDAHFLKSLPEGCYYFADVRSNAQVFIQKPKVRLPAYSGRGQKPKRPQLVPGQSQPQTVAMLARSGKCHWESVILAEGAKGPIIAKVARLRVYPAREGLPQEDSVWLFVRKSPDGKIKYSFSNAPMEMPLSEMCKASVMRWPIEQCFEEGKGQLGMDHYEHRSWPAWHRHMIYVFLGLHFMLRLRIQFKKNSSPHSTTSTEPNCGNFSPTFSDIARSNQDSRLLHSSESCRLSLSQEKGCC
jgi:SRSO17 transposase